MISVPIDLSGLRDVNAARCVEAFGHGVDGWSETDWACAVAGEVGELCNLIKKRRRGDDIQPSAIGDEVADVVIYLDLLCTKLGLDLTTVVASKFNEVSRRKGWDGAQLVAGEFEHGGS